jgi:hypothetical protein
MKRLYRLRIPEFIAAVVGAMFWERVRDPFNWLISDGWSYALAKCHGLSLWMATPITLPHGHVVGCAAGAVAITLTVCLLLRRAPPRPSGHTVWIPVSRNHR